MQRDNNNDNKFIITSDTDFKDPLIMREFTNAKTVVLNSFNKQHFKWSYFNNHKGLKTVIIGNAIKQIPPYAFANCPLNEIQFPETNITCMAYAFLNCGIGSLVIPANVALAPYTFSKCNQLTNITFMNGGYIPQYAFQHCYSLQCVKILNSIVKTECYTFDLWSIRFVYTNLPIRFVYTNTFVGFLRPGAIVINDNDIDNILSYILPKELTCIIFDYLI